ncbi:MAG: ParB/RepB/Spo0J family partition protein [Telluria sp.]
MSSARKPLKVSGLIAEGKVAPAAGVAQSYAFESQHTTALENASPAELHQPAPDAANEAGIAASTATSMLLDKTVPTTPEQWDLVDERVYEIDVAMVDDSPFQTEEESRDRYDPEAIDELAHTIANAGQQEPITVRWINNRFQLIAGHRRIRAARSLGWVKIRALVVRKNDEAAEKSVMVHNEGRKDLSDYAKAKLYQRAKQKGYAKKQDEIAHMFATKQGSVSKRLAMLTLPGPILAMLEHQKDLFSMNTAAVIHELVAQYPSEVELVAKAVSRIKTEGAPEGSIRGWFAQMLQASKKLVISKPGVEKPKVITDPAGRQLYTAKREGRVITLRVSAPELDAEEILEKMVEFFQTSAKTNAKTD